MKSNLELQSLFGAEVMTEIRRNRADKFLTGDQFKLFRQSRGLSQAELASWMGITQPSIANLEISGITRVQALALAAIDHCLQPWTPTDRDKVEVTDDGANDDE